MRLLLTALVLVFLVGCDPALESKYSSLKQENETASAQIKHLTAQVQALDARDKQIERQETEASIYLACSWPINLCPGAVTEAGKAAIEAGRGGRSAWLWVSRIGLYFSIWLMFCAGVVLAQRLYLVTTAPKKAEIETSKRLLADLQEASESMLAKAQNQAREVLRAAEVQKIQMAERLEQSTKELDQTKEQTSKQQAELTSVTQELASVSAALEQAKATLAKMEMLKNAMSAGS
jgi:DNA repair exonuclease SbcCD ATPase subunit